MAKTCSNCYWNDGQDCRNNEGSDESYNPDVVCTGWKPIKDWKTNKRRKK